MFSAQPHPFLISDKAPVRVDLLATAPSEPTSKKALVERLAVLNKELESLQRVLFADNRYALLLVFQAMDAAGKDSTIRALLTGVNPAGCQVFCFKQPSTAELDHDFLWRSVRCLPERGRIGVFNRSYYEEVLVVRVHPEFLAGQRLPDPSALDTLWEERFQSIRDHERHLALNGTIILKFWLNVSKSEQKRRFLSRLDEPHKHWKFSEGDLSERARWDDYMGAYGAMLNATTAEYAPWYAIPADDKAQTRVWVAEIVVQTLRGLGLDYPRVAEEQLEQFATFKARLQAQ